MTVSVERKIEVGFGLALACLALVGIWAYSSVLRYEADAEKVAQTRRVIGAIDSLFGETTDAQNAYRGYTVSGADEYLTPHVEAMRVVPQSMRRLRELTADNPEQQSRLERLGRLVDEQLAFGARVIELRRSQGFEAASNLMLTRRGKVLHDQIRVAVQEMKDAAERLLTEREAQARRSNTITRGVIIGAGLLGLAFVALSLYAIRRDLAGRARAEAELDRFFSLSLDFLVIAGGDGYFKRVSPAVTDILGWTVEEFLGRPFIGFVHPDDHASTWAEVDRQMKSGEKVLQFENRYQHKDGSWRVLSWRSMPYGDQMYATARDITELKASERQRLEAQLSRLSLLQHITRAIGDRLDSRSIFQVVVATLEDQLPLDLACIGRYDAASNELVVAAVGPVNAARAHEIGLSADFRIVAEENGLARCVRGQLVHEPDVREVDFAFPRGLAAAGLRSLVVAPLLVESQVFGALIAARREPNAFSSGDCEFLRQLSEHVALAANQAQLTDALQRAYEDLRQTQQAVLQQERLRALGQMASGIAHDINNAISPIALYTESLLEKEPNLSERARAHLETIRRAIEDVTQTVARMREFYRSREQQVALAPVDINRLVEQVIEHTRVRWRDMAQQRGVSIDVRKELDAKVPSILGAESELRDALVNVIFNAIDAMPEGGPLTIRTRVVREPLSGKRLVQLEVVDAGVGMDEETRRRCLEPFFTTKGERGTGLGLSMVYGTMQRHGAEIEIESAVGKGTTMGFGFVVPESVASASAAADMARPAGPLKMLLVDDDPLVLRVLADTLEADGHAVTTADGGSAGIEAFRAAHADGEPFRVVITDLGMPYVDGRKVASAIKQIAPATPVVLLTGWGQRMAAEGDTPAHVDRVLGKPPKLAVLRATLAELTNPS
jgi:PAS domain S-box-containing protein